MKHLLFFRCLLLGTLFFTHSSCKKFTEVPPPTNAISSENVFISDQTAAAVLNGLYIDICNGLGITSTFTGNFGFSLVLGLSADELTPYNTSGNHGIYYRNTLSPLLVGYEYWPLLYNRVFRCNAAIEGLSDPTAIALTPSIRKQLLGEARFLRAFYYFYLVNLYGDLPLALSTDYKVNSLLPRSPQTNVYQHIIADLTAVRDSLAVDYPDTTLLKFSTERVRPIQWAARALLSRVYLYIKEYAMAEQEASAIIGHTVLYKLTSLNEVFLKNSQEAIWQVQPTNVRYNTDDARAFILPPTGPSFDPENPVFVNHSLLDSFEMGDQRATIGNWISQVTTASGSSYYFPYKYKANFDPDIISTTAIKEYQMMLRLGEQYLIRAEARIRTGQITAGIEDLNTLRLRATDTSLAPDDPNRLPALPTTLSFDNALKAVYHERQVELFTEMGQRWFDLKRTGNIHPVMNIVTPLKTNGTGEWHDYQQLFPLPISDLRKAPNLVQNHGY